MCARALGVSRRDHPVNAHIRWQLFDEPIDQPRAVLVEELNESDHPLLRMTIGKRLRLDMVKLAPKRVVLTLGGLDDFSSNHPGGVNLLFADGSVHFMRSITTDGQERRGFWALGTRAGGEVIVGLDY